MSDGRTIVVEQRAGANGVLTPFDALSCTLFEGDPLVDLGANVSGLLWEWAIACFDGHDAEEGDRG
jgi:hypothetical protein